MDDSISQAIDTSATQAIDSSAMLEVGEAPDLSQPYTEVKEDLAESSGEQQQPQQQQQNDPPKEEECDGEGRPCEPYEKPNRNPYKERTYSVTLAGRPMLVKPSLTNVYRQPGLSKYHPTLPLKSPLSLTHLPPYKIRLHNLPPYSPQTYNER